MLLSAPCSLHTIQKTMHPNTLNNVTHEKINRVIQFLVTTYVFNPLLADRLNIEHGYPWIYLVISLHLTLSSWGVDSTLVRL